MEHAVIVRLRLSDDAFGSDEDREAMDRLEEELIVAIEEADAGEFDGMETGQGEYVFFMYGPDADRLFKAVEPALRASPATRGGFAVKRYGEATDPTAKEVRVDL